MSTAADRSRIADPALADEGERLIEWVARHSPVLNTLARTRLSDGALRGRKVAVVVHLEAKTAYLATLLAGAGAEVVAAGSNAQSTQDAVCAALVARGVEVHATHGASPKRFTDDLLAVADTGPEIVIDDGAELTRRIVEHRPDLVGRLAGVTEETTTGVGRLRAMERAGKLTFPAIAANDAKCKHMFDNPYGTGQTSLTAILRLTRMSAGGKRFCIVGYGWVGRGLATRAAALGGHVTVVELDPVRALTAHMDGHRVAPLAAALTDADVVITATGRVDAVPKDALGHLRDGVVLANAGHHDREIDVPALAELAGERLSAGPGIERYVLDGRAIDVCVGGSLVNIAGSGGNPVEIMDLSFSVQALSAHLLASGDVPAGLNRFPAELDDEIARTKLRSLGIELDDETESQAAFSGQWSDTGVELGGETIPAKDAPLPADVVLALAEATNLLLAGKRFVCTDEDVARTARAFAADVVQCEPSQLAAACADAEIVVGELDADALARLPDGAIVVGAVAGPTRRVRPHVDEVSLDDGRRIFVVTS